MSFFPSLNHQNLLLVTLKALGICKVVIDFDGSGDSGSIGDIVTVPEIDIKTPTLLWPEAKDVFSDNGWVKQKSEVNKPIYDILEDVADAFLEETDLDWYNNEGGFGTITLDLMATPPTAEVDVSIRITETEDHGFVAYLDPNKEASEYASTPSQPD